MSQHVIINGKTCLPGEVSLSNKSFRYGDGFFETMKWRAGKLVLAENHFTRFFHTALQMGYTLPALLTREQLISEMAGLTQKNKCDNLARIRLSAWRGEGGLFEGDDTLHYSLECWPLDEAMQNFNENGLVIGVYGDARKAADHFSRFKTSSFQPYNLAARAARTRKWNDALVLNTQGRIADSCIANIFIVRKGKIITPPLSEGPVAGVMRQQVLEHFDVTEMPITIDDLETADEIFLTNAIRVIRWVRQLGERIYGNTESRRIYAQLMQTI